MEALAAFLEGIEASPPARALASSSWLYPAVESVHLLGLAVLVGAAGMFDLRLLGVSRRLPVSALARHLLPWVWVGFLVAAVSGLLLLATQATETTLQPVFLAKMGLIGVAGVNALVFHVRAGRRVGRWDRDVAPPRAARIAGAVSLASWAAVVVLGRLIAYV